MTSAAIYARVSSARQKEQETIVSQTQALRAHAGQLGLDVPEEWVFEDDGYSGASLVRPALDRLRDLVAQVPVDVVLCHSPDRLARKYAYQALLMEELARAGTSVMFVKAPSGETPEDALLVQFQGMIAEYERAQIMERTRRGKNQRARSGSVNVLSGAPFGYRYVLAHRLGQQPPVRRVGHIRADHRGIRPHPRGAQQPGTGRLRPQRLIQPRDRIFPAPGGQLHQRRRVRHPPIQPDPAKPPPADRVADLSAQALIPQPVAELEEHQPQVALHRRGRTAQHRMEIRRERGEERRVVQ
jgi:DNA invertase Pin-like site-specific DNA recombinase